MVACFFPALKVIAIKEQLQLTSKGKKNEILSLRKINLFPPLIYNCPCDEFSAPTDSQLPPRKEKSCMVLPLFRTQSLFMMSGWQVWHLPPLGSRMRSAARSGSHYSGRGVSFWQCSRAAKGLGGRKTFKTEFGTLKNECLRSSR